MSPLFDPSDVLADQLMDEARKLLKNHPAVAVETIRRMQSLLLDAESYPELVVCEHDPETGDHFECPWCREACDPIIVDEGSWDTRVYPSDLDFTGSTYDPSYGHQTVMETLYVKSSCCQRPVRFPTNWTAA